ncbi:CBS domain-containing protein, partial [Candidatus Woesearchaeota archaeon]|nr:CBS domain-containing protein [Candidatus Woesearchaeota archaeon]
MTNKLKNYIIPITATFMDALKLIEFNQMRFVVVVDEDTVVGVLTDGDIRRSLLSGKRLN